MAERKSKHYPYRPLGFKLRSLREKNQESIADVSGAVEIDTELLVKIEDGLKLPDEDILLLLISHFGLQNDEALKLWRLAGYDNLVDTNVVPDTNNLSQQAAVFLLPIDSRVVYTDKVDLTDNNYGIVINFQQTNSQQPGEQPLTVARVGMSREHAIQIINSLQKVLKAEQSNRKSKNQKNNQA
jgi:hypothetical protein